MRRIPGFDPLTRPDFIVLGFWMVTGIVYFFLVSNSALVAFLFGAIFGLSMGAVTLGASRIPIDLDLTRRRGGRVEHFLRLLVVLVPTYYLVAELVQQHWFLSMVLIYCFAPLFYLCYHQHYRDRASSTTDGTGSKAWSLRLPMQSSTGSSEVPGERP